MIISVIYKFMVCKVEELQISLALIKSLRLNQEVEDDVLNAMMMGLYLKHNSHTVYILPVMFAELLKEEVLKFEEAQKNDSIYREINEERQKIAVWEGDERFHHSCLPFFSNPFFNHVVALCTTVDCIDCAADASVVNAVGEGIEAARDIVPFRRPWVMISINDDEDLHFRKAEFDPEDCPPDCSRPCERVCPANAISLEKGGVRTDRCYGCGRCFPTCPYDKIRSITYVRNAAATSQLLKRNDVDAVEIHTSARNTNLFKELWNSLADSIKHLKLVAVSLPDLGDSTISSMNMMHSIMGSHLQYYNLWQLDGRPMSGDIGRGATKEAIDFAIRLAAVRDRPDGFLQLAGGTNSHTIDYLKKVGLFRTMSNQENSSPNSPHSTQALISGVAYGGYARKIVGRVLNKLQSQHGLANIEDHPDYLLEALQQALNLVGPLKCYHLP